MPEQIIPQSAGSLAVAVMALIMAFLQLTFRFRKPQFSWYGWGAAISFSGMLYAVGIFFEYNAPPGPLNHFAGLLEYTAVLFLIHSLYGFTFSYLHIKGSHLYHTVAGIFHGLVIICLWSTDLIVADRFVSPLLIGLARPYLEPALGPLGVFFVIYCVLASISALTLWIRHSGPDARHRKPYLFGMSIWMILGLHDGIVSLGVPSFQYVMEYGFFAYSVVVLWILFDNFVAVSAEDTYRTITELANDGITVIQDGTLVFANPACRTSIGRDVLGCGFEELLDIVSPEDRETLRRHCQDLLDLQDPSGLFVFRLNRPNEEERTMEIRANGIRYRNRPAVLAVMRDVTERIREERARKENEEKIARLRKMESLGVLAGGVAHDLNNVLSGIISYPELMLLGLPEDSPLRKPITAIQDSGKRAVAIVQDLLTVARGVTTHKEPLNLNDTIRCYLDSPEYRKLMSYHPAVTITANLAPELFDIKGSSSHIGKVVMNLVSNAAEAIEGHGQVVISTMNRYLDRPLKGCNDIPIGEYSVMVVEDDGPGIHPDDLGRIFEPFYTKKVMGRSGTGLGLAVVWNAVQDHQGYIKITSNTEGTRFELYFPPTREEITIPARESLPLERLQGHGETILIVDDLEDQRDICRLMLERLKYQPRAVSSGEAAVGYLKTHTVDLLLLDMTLNGGMDGGETYEEIKKIHPRQKAVIISGLAERDAIGQTGELGVRYFLEKPLILEKLGMAVKRELER